METIEYETLDGYSGVVFIRNINYIDKSKEDFDNDNDPITLIHLINGEIIKTKTSIRTLNARISSS